MTSVFGKTLNQWSDCRLAQFCGGPLAKLWCFSTSWMKILQCWFLYQLGSQRLSKCVFIYLQNFLNSSNQIVQFWKVKRCLRVQISWTGIKMGTTFSAESKTQEFDQECMSYLKYLLWPLCVGGAIYSLLYEPHTG